MSAEAWLGYTPPRIGERAYATPPIRRGQTMVMIWQDKRLYGGARQPLFYAECNACRWRWPEAGVASDEDARQEAQEHARSHERRQATWYAVRDAEGTVVEPLSLGRAAEQVFALLAQGIPGDRIVVTVEAAYVLDE